MKYSDVPNSDVISENSLINLFGVEYINGKYEFRSNKTIIINGSKQASQDLYDLIKISESDSWASISDAVYGTTDLWWVICKFNHIVNPNIMPNIGSLIMIPKKEIVDFILSEIKKSGNKG